MKEQGYCCTVLRYCNIWYLCYIPNILALGSSPVFWLSCHYIETFISLHFKIIDKVSLYKNTSVQIDTGRKILDKIYINQIVRQGCNLSPAVFNIYIDDLLRNWKHKADAGIMLKRNLSLSTFLSADDQVIIQYSEDKLQKSVYILNQMSKD